MKLLIEFTVWSIAQAQKVTNKRGWRVAGGESRVRTLRVSKGTIDEK